MLLWGLNSWKPYIAVNLYRSYFLGSLSSSNWVFQMNSSPLADSVKNWPEIPCSALKGGRKRDFLSILRSSGSHFKSTIGPRWHVYVCFLWPVSPYILGSGSSVIKIGSNVVMSAKKTHQTKPNLKLTFIAKPLLLSLLLLLIINQQLSLKIPKDHLTVTSTSYHHIIVYWIEIKACDIQRTDEDHNWLHGVPVFPVPNLNKWRCGSELVFELLIKVVVVMTIHRVC